MSNTLNSSVFSDIEFMPIREETLYFSSEDGMRFTLELQKLQKWNFEIIDSDILKVIGASGKWIVHMSKKQFVEHFRFNTNQKCDEEKIRQCREYLAITGSEKEEDVLALF